jgi:putative ABC transport system ATP-binding protein
MLEAKDVTKIYPLGGIEVKALDNINLRIERGDFLAILGPSGSGKSTLLNLLGALDRPTRGSITLDGIDLARLPDVELSKIRRYKIGFVFQFFNLIPTLSALENITIPMSPVEKNRSKIREKAKELLENIGLGERINHHPSELSGGEQQRVALARALINNPLIILADEPTGNVDSKTGEEIIGLMTKLNQETEQAFVVVSHDPLITRRANKVIHLRDGRIVEETAA